VPYDEGCALPRPRWGHALAMVDPPQPTEGGGGGSENAIVVVHGGVRAGEVMRDLWCFDMASKRWSRPNCTGDLPTPRWGHSATQVAPHVLLFAGGREGSKPQPLSEVSGRRRVGGGAGGSRVACKL
jgi:hypothetical protein